MIIWSYSRLFFGLNLVWSIALFYYFNFPQEEANYSLVSNFLDLFVYINFPTKPMIKLSIL